MTTPTYPYDETYPFVVHSPYSGGLCRFKQKIDGENYIDAVKAQNLGWKVIDTTPLSFEEGFYLAGQVTVLYFGGKNKDDWYKVYDRWAKTEEPHERTLKNLKPMTVGESNA